jgi:hypothetical protein
VLDWPMIKKTWTGLLMSAWPRSVVERQDRAKATDAEQYRFMARVLRFGSRQP